MIFERGRGDVRRTAGPIATLIGSRGSGVVAIPGLLNFRPCRITGTLAGVLFGASIGASAECAAAARLNPG